MRTLDNRKYILAFVITAVIFFTAILLSDWLGEKKLQELRSIQDQISIDILSSEVQTALLEEFSCKNVNESALSKELGNLGERLSYAEETRGANDAEVIALKRYYSLLQIKDFMLMRTISQECGVNFAFILYFYGKDCEECQRQGYVLTRLRQDYPQLRVYSFDYNLDVSAIKTLISINKIENTLPALLIEDTNYYGFQSIEKIEEIIPQLAEWKAEREANASSTTATSSEIE